MSPHLPAQGAAVDQEPRRLPTVRARLLIWVNTVLGAAMVLVLFADYQQELRSRLQQKQIALAEEARALLAIMSHLTDEDRTRIQDHLDRVCAGMQEEESPGHHVAMRLNGIEYQAHSHHRASPELLAAMKRAAQSESHQSLHGNQALIAGSAEDGGNVVYVSEGLSNVRRVIFRHLLWRLGAMILLCTLAAVVVNLALVRLVARPVERLASTVNRIAQGELGIQTADATTREMAFLAQALNQMSLSLARNERERNLQLTKARSVQQQLLPAPFENEQLATAYLYLPASTVAGDYLDVLQTSAGSWVLCVADVTGHGIAAAMGAVILKTLLLEATKETDSPERILTYVNERFYAVSLPGDFASMIVVRWDPYVPRLTHASAGHEKGFLVSPEGCVRELESTGMPLAIEADGSWEACAHDLKAGDRLFLVTDGLAEAQSPTTEQFGRHHLAKMLEQVRDLSLNSIIHEVETALDSHRKRHPSDDDVTLLVVELRETLNDPGKGAGK